MLYDIILPEPSIVTYDCVTVTDAWQHDYNIMHNPNPKFQNKK